MYKHGRGWQYGGAMSREAALTTSATDLVGYPSGVWESSPATDYVSLRIWRARARVPAVCGAVGTGRTCKWAPCSFWTPRIP